MHQQGKAIAQYSLWQYSLLPKQSLLVDFLEVVTVQNQKVHLTFLGNHDIMQYWVAQKQSLDWGHICTASRSNYWEQMGKQ